MKQFKRIYVEITNVCNLSCSFCPKTKRTPQFMTYSEFSHILDQISPYTDYIYLHIKGEPLLHPDLEEFLNLCYKKNMNVNITSNGTLFNKAWNAIKDSPALRQINISLHSFSANDSTNFIEYIKTIIEKVKYLSENTSVISSMRLWNFNKDESFLDGRIRNLQILEYLESAFELESPILVEDLKEHGIKIKNRIYLNGATEFEWPALDSSYYEPSGYCYGLKSQIGILVDGTIVPCCLDGEGVINLGNIREESFHQIINSSRILGIIKGFENRQAIEDLCRHCSYKSRF